MVTLQVEPLAGSATCRAIGRPSRWHSAAQGSALRQQGARREAASAAQGSVLEHRWRGECESSHLERGRRQGLHAHKPLLPHERLHDLAAALRPRHAQRVGLFLQRQPGGLQRAARVADFGPRGKLSASQAGGDTRPASQPENNI